jgi:hypothetical protein
MKAFPTHTISVNNEARITAVGGEGGMELRDYFAAQALPICYQYWVNDYYHPDHADSEDRNAEGRDDFGGYLKDLIAEDSYSIADAMLRARELT